VAVLLESVLRYAVARSNHYRMLIAPAHAGIAIIGNLQPSIDVRVAESN
jgi:hypothetical protein